MPPWWTGITTTEPADAGALHALGLGFMASRTLMVALEFRLFTHLAGREHSLSHLARVLGLEERAARRLLSACVALGLVRATAAGFGNTPVSDKYLVEDRPTFIGSYLQMFDTLGYHRWEQMSTALRRNAPVDTLDHPYHYLAEDAEAAQAFHAAQHAGSRSLGRALARRIDFRPFHCVLDLGGGSGAYTVELLQHYPHLRAIIFDLPEVCRIAQEMLRQANLLERARTVAGNYETDPLPPGPDVVLWSGNLHASSPPRCAQVLQKVRALLPDGGAVLIHDYLLDATQDGPLIPALLALHFTLVSTDGQVYNSAELQGLLAQTGFVDIRIQPFLVGHSSLVTAYARGG